MSLADCRGLLFDLDGTLVDSAPDLARALDETLVEAGRAPVGEELTRRWVGNGARRLVARALTGEMWSDPEAGAWDAAMQRFFAHYAEHLVERTRPYPGVVETLEWLRQQEYALAVVTNKPLRFAEPLLEALGLSQYFALTLGGDSLPEKKPHPMPLLHAAERLQREPTELAMVGDSLNDVEAARAAGMRIICVPYGYNHGQDIRGSGPDLLIERFDQLATHLRQAA